MIRVARERIDDLFGVAASEAGRGETALADRCVRLARRIGMRYNVRLLREYHDLYCRGCSTYWVEGRSVRTRLRRGARVQTCLRCGRVRRTRLRAATPHATGESGLRSAGSFEAVGFAVEPASADELGDEGEEE